MFSSSKRIRLDPDAINENYEIQTISDEINSKKKGVIHFFFNSFDNLSRALPDMFLQKVKG